MYRDLFVRRREGWRQGTVDLSGIPEVDQSMPFSIISGWSVCAWFKVDNLRGFKTALAYWDDSTDGGRLLHMGTNGYRFSEYHNAASHTSHSYISVGVFPTHTWKHACILISNGDSGKKELWMDGVLINTVANVGTLGSFLAGSFQLFAGAKNANGHNPWDGAIDDIVVYDSFLSSDDMGSLYKRGITCDASAPPTHGGVGDCTNSLASGSTCQPTCNSGYTVSGTSSCREGTLTAATCSANPCTASPTSGKDGSDGTFYCINGGTIGGTTGSCTCTSCDIGYEGDNCHTASSCTASADSSKDGSDGRFYCINGGTVGGTTGSCVCTSRDTGYEGVSCQAEILCSTNQRVKDNACISYASESYPPELSRAGGSWGRSRGGGPSLFPPASAARASTSTRNAGCPRRA